MQEHEHSTSREQAKLDELRDVCRSTGLKLTNQRMEILRELAGATDHPSAETLYRRVRKKLPGVSLDTIYRTLGTFERLELIDRLNVAQDQGRFDADRSPHHHLVCRACKRIEDFCWETFDQKQLPADVAGWGRVESRHAVLSGICKECLADGHDRDSHSAIVRKPEGADNA